MYTTASGLIGFQSTILRVRITRTQGRNVWVTTADLLDSGTQLVIDASQVTPEADAGAESHAAGLVIFA